MSRDSDHAVEYLCAQLAEQFLLVRKITFSIKDVPERFHLISANVQSFFKGSSKYCRTSGHEIDDN